MTTELPIPHLRPYARQGRPRADELRAILKEIRTDLKHEAEQILYTTRRFTATDLCRLALSYELDVRATCEALEEMRVIHSGAWRDLMRNGFRPSVKLREVLAERMTDDH